MEDLYLEVARQLSDMGIDKENLSWSTRLTLVALILLISYIMTKLFRHLAYIIHSGFISGYQNRYGDNLKPPTNVYHRMTA